MEIIHVLINLICGCYLKRNKTTFIKPNCDENESEKHTKKYFDLDYCCNSIYIPIRQSCIFLKGSSTKKSLLV